jgi:hypothetical protein
LLRAAEAQGFDAMVTCDQKVGGFAGDHDTVADSLRHAEVACQVRSHGAVVTRSDKIGVRLIQEKQRRAVIHLEAAATAHDRLTVAGFFDCHPTHRPHASSRMSCDKDLAVSPATSL